jgi:hypothetical protein
MVYQAVRVSEKHPIVHAASSAITEETKRLCQTLCGAHLWAYSLIDLKEPITCSRCLRILERPRQLPLQEEE